MGGSAKKVKKEQGRKRSARRSRAGNGSGTLVWRGKVWQARWYANGRLVSRSTGTADLDEARAFLAQHSVARKGKADRAVVQKLQMLVSSSLADDDRMRTMGIPVRDLFGLFRDAPGRHPVGARTLEVYAGQMRLLADWIARRHPEITSARDISQTVADEYIADRAEKSSANTVNKDLNLFAAVWRTLARKYGLDYNPWTEDKIARRRLDSTSRRALTPAEVKAILAVAKGEMRLLIQIGLNTGLRMGDILDLTWDKLDMKARTLTVRTRKTGAPVCLPILPKLYADLKAQLERTEGRFVLPELRSRLKANGNPAAICRSVGVIFRDAGIKTQQDGKAGNGHKAPLATFHSLRHTFVTRLITKGVNPAIVREAVGHSTMLMTEHYTHIDADTLQQALQGTR